MMVNAGSESDAEDESEGVTVLAEVVQEFLR